MELQIIQNKIHEVRGQQVMLDFDLAELYEVETKNLNLAVKRNIKRFPKDFMFQLTKPEWESLRLQIETSKGRGGTRYLPYAFTEQGLAMLSGILNSDKAIEVNINIMRAFVAIRKYMVQASPASLSRELEEIKQRIQALEEVSDENEEKFDDIYVALTQLAIKQKQVDKPRTPIGFIKSKNGTKSSDG
jgi:uncharacterized protein YpbB